ncbi:hypothetical protein J1N35_005761 [Gossypium stocksii]|uniref:Uncharacterized protein n=1 Tax=Gossypium stocksii TaxID=47602 RepID=A0A9D4AJK4_9ROSI|nr:hypothetical protein J1N35_005761 [Gossypium stocksii]
MIEENEVNIKQNKDLTKCLVIVETKVKGLKYEVAVERESKEALQAELDRLTEEHVAETERIIWECQDQVANTIKEQLRVLERKRQSRMF